MYRRKGFDLQNDLGFVKVLNETIRNDFLRARLTGQIEWYVVKAHQYQNRYRMVSFCGMLIPIIILVLNTETWLPIQDEIQHLAIMILSGIVSVLNSMAGLFGWHDEMVRYRSTAERLKNEATLFIGGAGRYAKGAGEKEFIEEIENIALRENENWRIQEEEKKRDGE